MAAKSYFELDQMLETAQQESSLDDWGDDNIREPLEILFKALNEEAQFDDRGRARAKNWLNWLFMGRLRIIGDRKKYPDICREEFHQPIFMGGLPRAGTSYLNSLMACDTSLLAMYRWQALAPSPPPNLTDVDHGPQISYATNRLNSDGWLDPEIRDKHDYSPLATAEDTSVREYSFISDAFLFRWNVPTYAAYYVTADRTPAYSIEKKFLQALQYGTSGRRLAVKGPPHIAKLGLLFGIFPDARVVVNHRDPTKVMSSIMSLQIAHRKQFGHPPILLRDRASALGMMEAMASGVEDMIRRRRAAPELNQVFVDVNYVDLERDPIKQVERIYAGLDMELTDTTCSQMKAYIAANRKEKFGVHQYRIEDSGLRAEEVRDRFKVYLDYFDIPHEKRSP